MQDPAPSDPRTGQMLEQRRRLRRLVVLQTIGVPILLVVWFIQAYRGLFRELSVIMLLIAVFWIPSLVVMRVALIKGGMGDIRVFERNERKERES